MSATINISLFSDYFDQAPVLQVRFICFELQLYSFVFLVSEKCFSKNCIKIY